MSWPRSALYEALFPLVLERVSSVGGSLVSETRDLERGPVGPKVDEVVEETRELGWILGVLSAASGADVLLARRELDGVARVLDWVRRVLERESKELPAPDAPLTRLRMVEAGWEVPWLIGSLLHLAARDADGPWGWSLVREEGALLLRVDAAATAAPEELVRSCKLSRGELTYRNLERGWTLAYSTSG